MGFVPSIRQAGSQKGIGQSVLEHQACRVHRKACVRNQQSAGNDTPNEIEQT